MLSCGFAAKLVGKTDPSKTLTFSTLRKPPRPSVTDVFSSSPIEHPPMTCALMTRIRTISIGRAAIAARASANVVKGPRAFVQRKYGERARGELNLRHRYERAAQPFPYVRRNGVIQQRGAVGFQTHGTAGALFVKSIAHERDHRLRMGCARHECCVLRAESDQRGRHEDRMHRRDFQFIADGA